MPRFKVTAPDGSVSVEEATTQAEAITRAKQKKTSAAPVSAPESKGPDVVGRAKEWLTREPPAGTHTLFGETDMPGRIVRGLGDILLPGSVPEAARIAATMPIGGGMVTGPLMRTGAGALAGGVASALQGGDVGSSMTKEGLSQLAGEVLPGIARFGLTQRAGNRALAGRGVEIGQEQIGRGAEAKVRADKIAQDTAMEKAVGTLEKENYAKDVKASKRAFQEKEAATQAQHKTAVEAANTQHAAEVRAYEETGAQMIADSFKQSVPAFRAFPSNESGLLNMVYGEGPARMSARFDEVLKGVIQSGKGTPVKIAERDAKALGFKLPKIMKGPEGQPVAAVDAGELAQRATGFWTKSHDVYRRAMLALDEAGIGDPAGRAEYKAGQALIKFANSSKMLKGEKFNPEAARAAFTDLKKIDILRKRGQGDIFQGPVAEAVRRPAPELTLPPEPVPGTAPEVPKPTRRAIMPPAELESRPGLSPTPEGVKTRTLPQMTFWQGAALAELPALVHGLATGSYGYAHGLPIAVGGLLSSGLSGRRIVTKAPLGSMDLILRPLPTVGAQEARRMMDTQHIPTDVVDSALQELQTQGGR